MNLTIFEKLFLIYLKIILIISRVDLLSVDLLSVFFDNYVEVRNHDSYAYICNKC